MRKTLKRALSVVLSAAMALTMGGVGTLTNSSSAKAADAAPSFTAGLWSYGTFAGWAGVPSATVEVTEYGEYTLTAEATESLDDLFTSDNGTAVVIGSYAGYTDAAYEVVGKSIKVNDGEEIPWVTSPVAWDEEARLVINNAWNPDLDFATSVKQPIKAGDKISVTFKVADKNAAPDETETPSEEPTVAPSEEPTAAPVEEPTEEPTGVDTTAYISYADASWTNQYWYDGNSYAPIKATTAKVTGEGQYTVGLDFTETGDGCASGLAFTDLEVSNGETEYAGYTIKIDSFKINGEEVALGKGYTVTDDGKNTRYNIYNAWDTAKPEERIKDGARSWDGVITDASSTPAADVLDRFDEVKTIEITFTYAKGNDTVTPVEPTEAPTEAPAQTYNAYLGFQTDAWDYRDEWEKDANSDLYDFETQAMIGGAATDVNEVKIENAKITDNGTYTVSISGTDLTNASKFNMLFISTDIPAAMKDVKFSDIKVILDGTEVATLATGVVKKEVQQGSKKYYQIMAINGYGEAGLDLPEEFKYDMPEKSMELQFTVSGLDFGKDYSTKTYGAKKGTTFTSGNFKYKVTTAAKITAGKTTAGKVQVVGLSAAGKKKTSVSVGTSVKYTSNKQKATYTISSVAAGAFKGAAKLKAVTLSKNIKAIKKTTFQNCKKLATLTLKAKLNSVAKDSFKGCKKTITVKGTSKAANVKKLQKKNSSVKFK